MSPSLFFADVIVLAGTVVLTLAVWGVVRLPDTLARLHSASKAAALGVIIILLASVTTGQFDMMVRALVVAVFLSITAPVGSHAVARLETAIRSPDAVPGRPPAPKMRKSPRLSAGSSREVRREQPASREKHRRG